MATVHKLKNSASPQPSPARAALTAAIQRQRDAAQEIEALVGAVEKTFQQRLEARRELARVQAIADNAGAELARHIADSALGKKSEPPVSIKSAQAAVREAEETLAAFQRADDGLKARLKAAQESQAAYRIAELVEAVVHSDPATDSLLLAFAAKYREFRALQAAVAVIQSALTPDQRSMAVMGELDAYPIADAWRDALARLQTDPSAELPGLDVPITPGPVAA
jgi:peptidoglycan hydrolase CwlO-like protein